MIEYVKRGQKITAKQYNKLCDALERLQWRRSKFFKSVAKARRVKVPSAFQFSELDLATGHWRFSGYAVIRNKTKSLTLDGFLNVGESRDIVLEDGVLVAMSSVNSWGAQTWGDGVKYCEGYLLAKIERRENEFAKVIYCRSTPSV